MKKHLLKAAALLVLCYAMFGCGKEDPLNPTSQKKSIYGTVTDYATGELVSNANVRLNPIGETTLTGSDGMFEFTDVPNGSYSLSLSKNGYVDLDDDYVIEIKNGKSVRRDVQLKKNKVHVFGVVTNQYGNPLRGVDIKIYNEVASDYCIIAACNTVADGSYSLSFVHDLNNSDIYSDQYKLKAYYNWQSVSWYYFNVSYEQEFNINPVIRIE